MRTRVARSRWPMVGLIGAALGAALVASIIGHRIEGPPASGDVWTRANFFGVNAPLLRYYAAPERERSLDALSRSMAAADIAWARVVFDQAVEQRFPGPVDWTIPDRVVAALARHGVRTQALFIGTPAWVANPEALPCRSRAYPDNVDGWSAFVGAAVARYGRGGSFWRTHPSLPRLPIETWEIGNEENTHRFWCPEADPEKYAQVYAASRSAAIDADPRALVIVGGLARAFDEAASGDLTVPLFLRRMVDADPSLPEKIPAVAIHAYGEDADSVLQTIARFRDAMRRARLAGTPMIVDEVGWYTRGHPGPRLATQDERAARIWQITAAARQTDCNLAAFGVHSWVTRQTNPVDPEDWFGLADPVSGVPNASGRAYAAGIATAGQADSSTGNPVLGHLCG